MSNRVVEAHRARGKQLDSPSGSFSTGESAAGERARRFDLAQALEQVNVFSYLMSSKSSINEAEGRDFGPPRARHSSPGPVHA